MSTTTPREEWKLTELAEAVGVSARTVRYYVQRGLLPAPLFRGADTVYGEEHRVRLKAIRVLQARFLPLDAIQVELARLSLEELRRLSQAEPLPPPTCCIPPRCPPPPLEGGWVTDRWPVPPSRGVSSWRRWELVPGLELHLADTADEKTRALAEHLRALTQKS